MSKRTISTRIAVLVAIIVAAVSLFVLAGGPTRVSAVSSALAAPTPPDLGDLETGGGRNVVVVSATALRNTDVLVHLDFEATGGETTLTFNVDFQEAVLSINNGTGTAPANNVDVLRGSSLPASATLSVQGGQVGTGQIGLLLDIPAADAFTAGTRRIASLRFRTAANAPFGLTPVAFSATPLNQFGSANGTAFSFKTTPGSVNIVAARFEGDVNRTPPLSPTAGGGDTFINGFDLDQFDRFAAGTQTPSTGPGSEFQALDTNNSGCITPADKEGIRQIQIAIFLGGTPQFATGPEAPNPGCREPSDAVGKQ